MQSGRSLNRCYPQARVQLRRTHSGRAASGARSLRDRDESVAEGRRPVERPIAAALSKFFCPTKEMTS